MRYLNVAAVNKSTFNFFELLVVLRAVGAGIVENQC